MSQAGRRGKRIAREEGRTRLALGRGSLGRRVVAAERGERGEALAEHRAQPREVVRGDRARPVGAAGVEGRVGGVDRGQAPRHSSPPRRACVATAAASSPPVRAPGRRRRAARAGRRPRRRWSEARGRTRRGRRPRGEHRGHRTVGSGRSSPASTPAPAALGVWRRAAASACRPAAQQRRAPGHRARAGRAGRVRGRAARWWVVEEDDARRSGAVTAAPSRSASRSSSSVVPPWPGRGAGAARC